MIGTPARKRFFLLILILPAFFMADRVLASDFPQYPVIGDNVAFWQDIYAKYSTEQAVLHDSRDLSLVYAVVTILDHRLPGASKINRPRLKLTKKKYRSILKKLASGKGGASPEEKKISRLLQSKSKKQILAHADSLRIQLGQRDRFLDGVIRSGAYIREIKQIFRSYNLPPELAYLPHVESSFNLRAHSKRGASGIWQFTRSTGKNYLAINSVVDERRDPLLASHAAARFLKKNYALLGSWPLAITAYNYGPSGMMRAQKAMGSYEKIFRGYSKGYFKFASRNFYSEFLAALTVARQLENNRQVTKRPPFQYTPVKLKGYIALADISRHFKVDPATIKSMNPALKPQVLTGKKRIPKGYTLRLPASPKISKQLLSLPGRMVHSKQIADRYHIVRAGDTAGKIALRYKVRLRDLKKVNRLNKKATVYTGQKLILPSRSGQLPPSPSKNKSSASARPKDKQKHSVPLLRNTKKKRVSMTLPPGHSFLYTPWRV
ncbi:MAG: transglycosylase SLT domain-containing protein [Thermodesulfobacteriota bacterium]